MKDNQLIILGVVAFMWWNMQDKKPTYAPPAGQRSSVTAPPQPPKTQSAKDALLSGESLEQTKAKEAGKTERKGLAVLDSLGGQLINRKW